MDLEILFAGTAGSCPTPRRGLPATVVSFGPDRLLFDCGEGTQRQLSLVDGSELDAVFLTHFHSDHWLGLPGLLASYNLHERDSLLRLYGPKGVRRLVDSQRNAFGELRYPLEVIELADGEEVRRDGYTIQAIPVDHRGPSVGYVITEDSKPGRLNAELAEQLGVRPGPDFGRLISGETVGGVRPEQVIGRPRRGRKVALSGDCAPTPEFAQAAAGADVLVHEATFTDDEHERACNRQHSTGRQAARLAADAGVKLLAVNHLSVRTHPGRLCVEARQEFARAFVAEDFATIEVPLPDRGEPQYNPPPSQHMSAYRRSARASAARYLTWM